MQISFNKDSSERALRTVYHGIIALIGAVPTIVLIVHNTNLDTSQQVQAAMGAMVLWTGIASKIVNVLEERGMIPSFLKSANVVTLPPEPSDQSGPVVSSLASAVPAVSPISESEHTGPLADSAGNVLVPETPPTPVLPTPVVPPVPVSPDPAVPPAAP